MERISWESIGSSKAFRFTVGPQKREFTIHTALVACQSHALKTLVSGNFSEARNGHAVLEAVDEQTFARFLQYAYTGDYDATAADAAVGPWSRSDAPLGWSSRSSHKETLNGEDKAEVFLSHARLHVFADYYGVSDLMDLTLKKLGGALILFKPSGERSSEDIVALLRYCYDTPAPEVLKSFVVLYAACKAEVLWKSEAFQELAAGNCELLFAFLGQVMETLA
ncbi:Rho-related BTB domain-containing protein 3 [Chaetomidium leptoderma]|uniref:Rho-related BTB domain-containing protein 3 n=1 Tax=Chaetomidium leptoderma TaxID=669021 RepID=A0AAN6VHF0_9PEZI|nr:Rho-related BTB domain-containing protein 3 [Chaetomidium leptoderma]